MNREIKFRAWHNLKKEWLHNYAKMGGISLFGETIVLGGWLKGVSIKDWDEIVVQQFTGLFDENGKGIYEGDIVTVSWLKESSDVWVVAYVPPCFLGVRPSRYEDTKTMKSKGIGNCWYVSIDADSSVPRSIVKVVGNIFENPELLENKD